MKPRVKERLAELERIIDDIKENNVKLEYLAAKMGLSINYVRDLVKTLIAEKPEKYELIPGGVVIKKTVSASDTETGETGNE